jgi:hypothetical protein
MNNGVKNAIISVTVGAAVFCFVPFVGQLASTRDPSNIQTVQAAPRVEARVIPSGNAISTTAAPRIEYVSKPVPVQLRMFVSLTELQHWLLQRTTTTRNLYFVPQGGGIHCADYALTLQAMAAEDGYMLSFQIIDPSTYNPLFRQSQISTSVLHAINLAIVGNEAYYIEPQTGEVVLAAMLR